MKTMILQKTNIMKRVQLTLFTLLLTAVCLASINAQPQRRPTKESVKPVETEIPLIMPQRQHILDNRMQDGIAQLKNYRSQIPLSNYDKEVGDNDKVYLFTPKYFQIITDNRAINNEKFTVDVSYEMMKTREGIIVAVPFPIIRPITDTEKVMSCKGCGGGLNGFCTGNNYCVQLIYPNQNTRIKADTSSVIVHRQVKDMNVFSYQTRFAGKSYVVQIETEIPKQPVAMESGMKWCRCEVPRESRVYYVRIPKAWSCENVCKWRNDQNPPKE